MADLAKRTDIEKRKLVDAPEGWAAVEMPNCIITIGQDFIRNRTNLLIEANNETVREVAKNFDLTKTIDAMLLIKNR